MTLDVDDKNDIRRGSVIVRRSAGGIQRKRDGKGV